MVLMVQKKSTKKMRVRGSHLLEEYHAVGVCSFFLTP